jgi:inosine-uridine nucleoside N-ribohydrolase
VASTKYEGVAAVLSVLNTYFKKPDIPIGVPKGKALELKDVQHWTDTLIARYPHKIKSNNEVPDAVALYRSVLSKQPDSSVTIITVGFLTNISNLLRSQADVYSPLSGIELVRQKVSRLVSMAGKFPEGSEFNVKEDALASQYAFDNFPKTILYSGFEIGANVKSGLPLINNKAIKNSPVKDVFEISIPMAEEDKLGRMSWDQTAVLVAIRGHKPFYKLKEGKIVVDEKGYNTWDEKGKGQFHLVEAQPPSKVSALINDLMMHRPR